MRIPQQNITDWVAYTTEIYFPTVMVAGNPRSRCCQDWFLLSPSSEAHLPTVFSHGLSSVCALGISSYKDKSPIGLGPHPYDLIQC